jgi:hypothetical protein
MMIRLTFYTIIIWGMTSIQVSHARQQDPGQSADYSVQFQTGTARASEVFAKIGKLAGVTILADSTLDGDTLPFPKSDARITADNIEWIILQLLRLLPEGASWAKLYLPPPPDGKEWKGDDVVAYARAQAKLYGIVGKPGPAEIIEILSQKLPISRAKDVIAALNLKPVYVITGGRGNYTGTWTSTFGEMHLKQSGQRVTGTYTFSDGHIDGRIVGKTMQFKWEERDTGGLGLGIFMLSEDGNSIEGQWTSGAEDPHLSGSSWTGQRISRK